MKIHINNDEAFKETEITINCARIDSSVEKLIQLLSAMDVKLTGIKNKQTFILEIDKVLYIESVDKKAFIYTDSEVYESSLRLYELEEMLAGSDYLRVNKSCIINMNAVSSLRVDLDGKLLITMKNGEKLLVSRQYAPDFKKKLGVK